MLYIQALILTIKGNILSHYMKYPHKDAYEHNRSKHKRAADIKLSYQEFQTLLRTVATDVPSTQHDNRTRYFVYQPTLVAPKTLYEKLNIDPSRFAFSTCYPDFLEIVPRTDPSGKGTLCGCYIRYKFANSFL